MGDRPLCMILWTKSGLTRITLIHRPHYLYILKKKKKGRGGRPVNQRAKVQAVT